MPSPTRLGRLLIELRSLLALAAPIMIAQLANTAMGFADTVMAGRVSPRDLASVALGNSIWVPVFLLMTGILLATTPKVAQRFGGGLYGAAQEADARQGGSRGGGVVQKVSTIDGVHKNPLCESVGKRVPVCS